MSWENSQGQICGWALMGHVPVQKITDNFVLALCSKLAPGIDKYFATKPPTTKQ
jgi:hypothetical protein